MKKSSAPTSPPALSREIPISLTTGVTIGMLVLLAIPISQMIDNSPEPELIPIGDNVIPIHELFEEEPPPIDEKPIVDIEPPKPEFEFPDLIEIATSLMPDMGSFFASRPTSVGWEGDAVGDIIHDIGDLTRQPRPIAAVSPQYPPELRRARVSGSVSVKFVVTADGLTQQITIESTTHEEFAESVRRALRNWRFEPGQKDGKPVASWARMNFPFNAN